jgi:hypothetical protein
MPLNTSIHDPVGRPDLFESHVLVTERLPNGIPDDTSSHSLLLVHADGMSISTYCDAEINYGTVWYPKIIYIQCFGSVPPRLETGHILVTNNQVK